MHASMTIDSSAVPHPSPPPEQAVPASTSTACCIYDVAVIGGGVVGLSILREATLQGYRACLVERNAHLLCGGASGRNSGIACTGADAPVGSLERALIRESIATIRIHCHRHNVPHRDCGSLVCAWPWDNNDNDDHHEEGAEEADDDEKDHAWARHGPSSGPLPTKKLTSVLRQSHEAGDAHATYLPPDRIRAVEPHLNPECRGAVHIPGEIVLDPWLFPVSLAVQARENGALVFTDFAVNFKRSTFDATARVWTLVAAPPGDATSAASAQIVRARAVVNAAGVWADVVDRGLLSTPPPYESRPRRGQYLVVRPQPVDSDVTAPSPIEQAGWEREFTLPPHVLLHPIQPVPTHHSKGVFVFSSLYRQIVVGPTALDQDDRQNDIPCPAVRRQLAKKLQRTLRLSSDHRWEIVGEYVGIRPGTDHRDYQIHLQVDRCWVTCAGIRSTGT